VNSINNQAFDEDRVTVGDVELHTVLAGPKDGPLVILLHGFPEFWYGWRHQIPFLAAAGYRVWAPDQRGYNLSDKPEDVADYNLDRLAADVVALIDAAGRERTHLVGHDWGAAVAWWVAAKHPERLAGVVAINVPHPVVMRRTVRHSLRQLARSWYIAFFQLPWLPEVMARLGNWRIMTEMLRRWSQPGTFSDADLDHYRAAWSQPGAYTAMLNWYRAMVRHPPDPLARPRISVPTLLIWGARDVALGREMAQPSIDLCEDGQLVFLDDATHWVHHEEPQAVNDLIRAHLTTAGPGK
jgi:pimeloyl-ACP methyl ester carboxylesterase